MRYALLAQSLAESLTARGWVVAQLSPASLSVAGFEHQLQQTRSELVWSINFSPELAWLCSRRSIPYVSWTIDPLPLSRLRLLDGTRAELCLCFAHSRQLVQELSQIGLQQTHFLPLAATTAPLPPGTELDLEPTLGLTFVGDSLAREAQACTQWLTSSLSSPDHVSALDFARSRFADHQDDARFQGLCVEELRALPLSARCSDEQTTELAYRLNGLLAHWHRTRFVRELGRFGILVYGDAHWGQVSAGYRGAARPGKELSSIYQCCTMNLDLVRLYQRHIATLRAFDVLGVGGLLLTEAGGDLEQLVDPEGYVRYRNLPDLMAQLQPLLADPRALRAIAARGLEAVRAEHLLVHRVERIEGACRALGWHA